MKKLLSVSTLAIACVVVFSFQNALGSLNMPDEVPNSKIVAAAQHDFPKAIQIKWTQNGKMFIANFNSEAGNVIATYNKRGFLLSTLINSDAQHIPFTIQMALNNTYPGYVPQNMTECINTKEHCYYILLKYHSNNMVKWMRVKTDETGNFHILQKLNQPI